MLRNGTERMLIIIFLIVEVIPLSHPNLYIFFQIDLFYMKSKTDSDNDEYKIAMGCIDIFSKYAVVIALHNKQSDTLLDGLKQFFN